MQFHENIRLEDPDRFFAPNGALEACPDAQKAGKIRFIGFTGHKDPSVHIRIKWSWQPLTTFILMPARCL